MAENFPNLERRLHIQVHEANRSPPLSLTHYNETCENQRQTENP